jgi:hypothetical protein
MNVCEGLEDFLEASTAILKTENVDSAVEASGRDPSTGFDCLWEQLGRIVRSYPYSADVPTTSFGRLVLRDVLLSEKSSFAADTSNFWVCPKWANIRLTTHAFIGGEEGFVRVASRAGGAPLVFFALEYAGLQPRMYKFESCVCYAIPEIIGPHAFLGWLTMFFAPSELTSMDDHHQQQRVPAVVSSLSSEDTVIDVHKLFVRWKTERPGQKPTIPKLADFGGVDAEKLKKMISRGPKPWTQLLNDYGFRAASEK